METQVILTMRENKRLIVIQEVMEKKRTLAEGVKVLGMSERQGWRLLAQVRKRGALGVVHGNRGRVSSRRIPDKIREKVIYLRQKDYPKFNDRHFTQELEDQEKIHLSRETIRQILRSSGIVSVHPVKKRKHRLRRMPKDRFGEMLQGDASPHDWLKAGAPSSIWPILWTMPQVLNGLISFLKKQRRPILQ
jgi:hypothetical protein